MLAVFGLDRAALDMDMIMSEIRETGTRTMATMRTMTLDPDACYRAVCARDARFDGSFFTGVTTTGIYCRPICPAPTPKRENVVFFASAAAAQAAGFRPCLRCRPEIAPDVAAWRGTSNTVSRALALMEKGALHGAPVAVLAERLGLGERQLRRLFRQHLGASPLAVAQTHRLLLAKQLIHETQLSMTEVALAAGFGSVRRFNETFRQMFQRQPASLRRSKGAVLPSRTAGDVSLNLSYRAPYDWDSILTFLARRAIPGIEAVVDASYARTIEIDGQHGIVSLRRGAGDALHATIRFPRLAALPMIIARLRRVFDLAADPQAIAAHLAEDRALAPLVAARPGLRVPGAWDGFELAVRALLGQQISVAAARTLAGRLVAQFGTPLMVDRTGFERLTHVFPQAAALAAADVAAVGLPKTRSAALTALAAAVAADPLIFGLRATLDEAVLRLRGLAGVGEWTAQYIAMRELREPDAFPAADLGLMRAIGLLEGRQPSPKELLARAENWRPWRAYAAQHLWAAEALPTPTDRPAPFREAKPAKLAM
ncbi:putative bifunctional transcriptional activator/DNA repair enzyme AlkA [Methylovirgula sp. HY1]|nr:putative bifunctional transcriptional activator/DNA repair enzyme AlkA [Methylovirgula sp. HY1]